VTRPIRVRREDTGRTERYHRRRELFPTSRAETREAAFHASDAATRIVVPRPAKSAQRRSSAVRGEPVQTVAERTMADIMNVATDEFAREGLSGARIDEIAARTRTSKRMIYYHFGSKEALYLAVLEAAYRRLRSVELGLDLEAKRPDQALRQLVRSTFDHHHANPDTVRIIMNENLHYGAYIRKSNVIQKLNVPAIDATKRILERGEKEGVFRRGIDPIELHMTISALSFHHVANRYSFSAVFDVDMSSKAAIQQRGEVVADLILAWVARPAKHG
jgi:AcrR family transcriptional regulator